MPTSTVVASSAVAGGLSRIKLEEALQRPGIKKNGNLSPRWQLVQFAVAGRISRLGRVRRWWRVRERRRRREQSAPAPRSSRIHCLGGVDQSGGFGRGR